MSHELDVVSIENIIQQAKQERARHMSQALAPALKAIGGFALIAVMMPWHLVRHALTGILS